MFKKLGQLSSEGAELALGMIWTSEGIAFVIEMERNQKRETDLGESKL